MYQKMITLIALALSFQLQAVVIDEQQGTFELLPLPYSYSALEPAIDERTLHLHHDKHHRAYVDNLNLAIKDTEWTKKTLPEMFADAALLPIAVRNNAGGHWNHTFYWEMMTPSLEKRKMPNRLKDALESAFGSIEKFKEEFLSAGLKRFGSGYAWLIQLPDGKLQILSTANQDNPLMTDALIQGKPLLVCDVWEHTYYLKYTYLRGDYLKAFWNIVNWHKVDEVLFPNEPLPK